MKIFVTVGTQAGFDRLISAIDRSDLGLCHDIFMQIGVGVYEPVNFKYCRYTSEEDFLEKLSWCDLIVAHAGMGSIISAIDCEKNIIICPRRADFGEHRNDHQMSTARFMTSKQRVTVCYSESEIFDCIQRMPRSSSLSNGIEARDSLVGFLREIIFHN